MRPRSLLFRSCPILALAWIAACAPQTPEPVEPQAPAVIEAEAPEPAPLSAQDIQRAIAFLADDAQEGRPPGGEADARVQAWVVERMGEIGLEPGASSGSESQASFVQTFEVGDGARLRAGEVSKLEGSRGEVIAHSVLPFGHDTGQAPVEGKLVFVGHGVLGEGEDAGDFTGLDDKLDGAIAVALVGSPDPHAAPARTRPQSKLIAARDRGAVGFILWDPESDTPWPNHGSYGELEIPAVFVGKSGSPALRKALRVRGETQPKIGQRSRAPLHIHTPIEAVTLRTANVIGVLPGSGPAESRKRIYVGAHMDHLGHGTSSSLAPGEAAIHNGADDNASGVAVVLELAEVLAEIPASHRPHDLVFVAFGAEEMGLLGSKHLVEGLAEGERERTLAMLNFDMVGRLQERLMINGSGTAKEWPAIIAAANGGQTPLAEDGADNPVVGAEASSGALIEKIEGSPDGWGPSDHASFYGEGVPVLHFFTGSHEDYHKPSDDIEKVDSEGAARIGELAGGVVMELMDRCEPLTFVEVERPTKGTRFRVSLGTMPDYGREVDGLALGGVREGGPAEAAGLQKGDVITRIGEREIHNIDDFMACFGELEPGVAVEVEFVREGERHTAQMVPAAPRAH